MATTLLEREVQLRRIDELIADAGGGTGGVISIEGVAGIGKTELLRAARERASGAGLNVLSARCGELERDMAFGVARQLLELAVVGGSDAEQAALLAGAAELARGALGLAGGQAASPACEVLSFGGSITQVVSPGRNEIVFSGRVAGRRLSPGVYRASLTVRDLAGNASAQRVFMFKVIKPK